MNDWFNHIREVLRATWRLRPHLRGGRYLVAAVIATAVLTALMEGVALGLLVPLMNLLLGGEGATPMRPIRWAQEWLPGFERDFYVLLFCVLVLGAIVAKNIIFYLSQVLAARLRRRISTNLQLSLYERLHSAEMHLFEQRSAGEMTNIFGGETGRTLGTVELIITLVQRVSIGLFYLLGLFIISWQLTLCTLVLAGVIGASIGFLYRKLARVGREISEANKRFGNCLLESFAGIRVVRATHSQQREIARFKEASEAQAEIEERIARHSTLLLPVAETVAVAGAMVMIGGAYILLVKSKLMLPSYLFGFGVFLLRLLPLINQIYGLQSRLFWLAWGVREVEKWLDTPQFPQRPFGTAVFDGVREAIRFERVNFTYPNATVALTDLAFEIRGGKTLALVGHSGSGKTTVAALLQRFRQPTAGRILVDGRDFWEFSPESWHKGLGVVEQEAFLFHDTLRNNIGYGFPAVTQEQIDAAIRIALLDDVVKALPDGLDTVVGERGMMLSGGQRQRLAIARAIVRDAKILILDEATSSLDSISERQVQAAMESAMKGRTVLVIAHRLSTVQSASHIVVLSKGRVAEQGTWAELVERKGEFATLLEAASGRPSSII
jgi:ABC-type multidrug transport system fused ATPase/permease subunit